MGEERSNGIPALEKTVLIRTRFGAPGQARIADLEAQLALHKLAVRTFQLANRPCRPRIRIGKSLSGGNVAPRAQEPEPQAYQEDKSVRWNMERGLVVPEPAAGGAAA